MKKKQFSFLKIRQAFFQLNGYLKIKIMNKNSLTYFSNNFFGLDKKFEKILIKFFLHDFLRLITLYSVVLFSLEIFL